MEEKKTSLNLKWLKHNFSQPIFFPALIILLSFTVPSLVDSMATDEQLRGSQFYGEPCKHGEHKDEDGVPILKCYDGHDLDCLTGREKCGCEGHMNQGMWVETKWDPTFNNSERSYVTKPGRCLTGENGGCLEDMHCIRGLECQRRSNCFKPATKLFGERCQRAPSTDFCMTNRDLDCTDAETGSYNFQCRCIAGKWNKHATVHNSKFHPTPVSSIPGKCQIPEGQKCGEEAKANWNIANKHKEVPCWEGTECKYQERLGIICVKKDEPKPKATPPPKPKETKKTTPKSKNKFIESPCKNDCDHVNGESRFLFCHHDKCECLPSPKKGAQVPTMWDPLMQVPGLNETGQCVIKDTHDCVDHFMPYSCRTGHLCGEKGKCIKEPTFIDEPCKDNCDHVQGDDRFLTCHSGKCGCLPSAKFSDKNKKKIKQVLTEWDAKKQVQNLTHKGQCVIQEEQDCEGHLLPIECKTGFYCGAKGRCAKAPTFINEPCKDTCDHVEGDERFLTCHDKKCVCLPSTKFADQSKKKLVQVETEWDPLKVVKGAKTKFKGQCVVKSGKDCTDHLMSYECRTGFSCGGKGTCEKSSGASKKLKRMARYRRLAAGQ